MGNNQWAVICTIRQEPEYKFIQNERRMADRMERDGLLRHEGNGRFIVTKAGEREYGVQ